MKNQRKGKISELAFQIEATKRGFEVLVPLIDIHYHDFVILKDNQLIRIQVKSSHTLGNGNRNSGRSHYAKLSGNSRRYSSSDIDFFAIHVPLYGDWYIFPVRSLEKVISIRFAHESGYGGKYERFKNAWHLLQNFKVRKNPRNRSKQSNSRNNHKKKRSR